MRKNEIFPEKLKLRKAKFRRAGTKGLVPCSACTDGNHVRCEEVSFIYCACWRRKHKKEKK